MTNQDTIRFLKTIEAQVKGSKLDPLKRPLLIVYDREGREWWISATHVGKTKLLGGK